MTATQKAWFTVIYFLFMLPLSYLSRRWLWEAICKAGGTTVEGVKVKRRELIDRSTSSHSLQASFESWMTQNAPDPEKFRRLLRLYQVCLAPNILCAFFSLGGLYTHALDTVIKIGMFVVPLLIIVVWIIGIWYKKHNA